MSKPVCTAPSTMGPRAFAVVSAWVRTTWVWQPRSGPCRLLGKRAGSAVRCFPCSSFYFYAAPPPPLRRDSLCLGSSTPLSWWRVLSHLLYISSLACKTGSQTPPAFHEGTPKPQCVFIIIIILLQGFLFSGILFNIQLV